MASASQGVRDMRLQAYVSLRVLSSSDAESTHYHTLSAALMVALRCAKNEGEAKTLDLALRTLEGVAEHRGFPADSWQLDADEQRRISQAVVVLDRILQTAPWTRLRSAIHKTFECNRK